MNNGLQLFENKKIRTAWDEQRTGKPVITSQNAVDFSNLIVEMTQRERGEP